MTNQVSITIPLQLNTLKHAIAMLTGMAHDLELAALTDGEMRVSLQTTQNCADPDIAALAEVAQVPESILVDPLPFDPVAAFGATTAAESATPPAVSASSANDSPFPGAPSAPAPGATTSTSTITETATSVPVDSEGLPWDGRIHSSSKEKLVKDSTWKLKRGVDKALVEQVKAELRGVMAIPADVYKKAAETAPVTETHGLHPNPNPLSVSAVNAIVAAQSTAPAPTAPAAGRIVTFADLMKAITEAKMDQATVAAILPTVDPAITSLAVLAPRPELIPRVAAALGL